MMKTSIASFATLLLTTVSSSAESFPAEVEMPAEKDLQSYFACSEAATRRPLTFDEASACAAAFQRIKLSFVPGVGPSNYNELGPVARSEVNRIGYQGYLSWSEKHALTVETMKAKARTDLVLTVD